MSTSFEKYQKRRLRSSYFSVIISISLVLFLVGALGILFTGANTFSKKLKEKVFITVFIKKDITEKNILTWQKDLEKKPFVKKVLYTSKDQAAKQYAEEIGEDFVSFIGDNPLKSSLDIYIKSDYLEEDKIKKIEKDLLANKASYEVNYDKNLVKKLLSNVKQISFWLLVVSAIFMIIAIVLINSSIRLSVYSKRFTIKTMQMVGATKSFIRRPFVWKSIKLGITGALIAIIALSGLLYYINENLIHSVDLLENKLEIGIVFAGILFLGIAITWFSTFLATQRFLNLRTEDLY